MYLVKPLIDLTTGIRAWLNRCARQQEEGRNGEVGGGEVLLLGILALNLCDALFVQLFNRLPDLPV